jgi:hypothetical protein
MSTTCEISSRENEFSSLFRPGFGQKRPVFEIDPLHDPRWKVFVGSHPDASVFHQVEWLEALQSCYGYEPAALTLTPPGAPLENGLVYCRVQSKLTGNRIVSLPFSDHCEPLINAPEELNTFAGYLAGAIEKNGWKYFELRPILHTPDHKKELGVSQSYYFHRLDLLPSEQLLFKRFHKDCIQRKILRAEREALRCEAGTSETLLQDFYKLMIMTRRRQGLPPQPLAWFRSLIASMGKNANIWVASKGDTPVSSIFTLTNKKTLIYKYGCSDSRFSNLGGTTLLFWNAIQRSKAAGIEEFDLGRSDITNPGLITFKEHWGSERSSVNYWRYPFRAASSHPERLIRRVKKLISIAPDRALVLLGNVLYRHVG